MPSSPVFRTLAAAAFAVAIAAPALGQAPMPDSTAAPSTPAPEAVPTPATPAAPATPVATAPPPGTPTLVLTLPPLLPARSSADLRRDQGVATGIEQSAEAESQALRIRIAEARARVNVKKQEIGVIESKLKLAKKNKQPAEVTVLERERKRLEAEQRFLERLQDVDEADLDRATASRDYGRAWAQAASAEIEFLSRAAERTGMPTRGIRDIEVRVLTAQRTTSEKLETLARKQQDLAAKRVRVHDAWNSLQAL